MNFGPDWIRNLSSEGSTGGGTSSGTRYQLADYRYGREEMLALFDKNVKPPASLTNFKSLYSETTLLPLALLPSTEEERGWSTRPSGPTGISRGRGSLDRGGRASRGRGGYASYNRIGYESGWGNGEQPEWSPRKDYNSRTISIDNWRRNRTNEEEDGWRSGSQSNMRGHEKWGRSTSWRGGDGDSEERSGPPERGTRSSWHDLNRGQPTRRSWDNEDHLPEWATENPTEGGGTFDERGAFHGSDDEQLDGKTPPKRENALQKSVSQQHIISKPNHSQLSTSKSTISLVKSDESSKKVDQNKVKKEEDNDEKLKNGMVESVRKTSLNSSTDPKTTDTKEEVPSKAGNNQEGPPKFNENPKQQPTANTNNHNTNSHNSGNSGLEAEANAERRVEEDFGKFQEDFILKLVEEAPKQAPVVNNFDVAGVQPPPNLIPPVQDQWFYQDPQGQRQGPFTNMEMAEWYKAGYFSHQLKVRRLCDERFFLLGDLITLSNGANPFETTIRYPVLKADVTKTPEADMLQYHQYLTQMAVLKQQAHVAQRAMTEPWNALTLQQQELAAQRLMLQQQVPQELQYMQMPPANPLMQMINQMQQAKIPVPGLDKAAPAGIPNAMDPVQMLLMQNKLPQPPTGATIPNHLTGGLPTNLSGPLPPEAMPGLQANPLSGGLPIPGMQTNLPNTLNNAMNIPRPTSAHGNVDGIPPTPVDNDPISSLLKQLQQQKEQSQKLDSFWQQSQFLGNNVVPQAQQAQQSAPQPPQQTSQNLANNWQPQPQLPLWNMQQQSATVPQAATPVPAEEPVPSPEKTSKKDTRKEESKEAKKKKEMEEKQAKKEAEEKRKQEQRKQEAEKKANEEKKKKEEERNRKEMEKAKKEAEEKRYRELEEKRKLKEQRKQEEENKRKLEEMKKMEEARLKKEAKEMEERQRNEEKSAFQDQSRIAKIAPWSQSNSNAGMSLADIQKAEREKRAQEAALQLQKQQQLQEQQAVQQEKATGIQLNWARKPVEPRKVKSLAEIQAEEQERLAKQAAEARLHKEKEQPAISNPGNIWNSQTLTWASATTWSSNTSAGFWDESPSNKQQQSKPSTVSTKTNVSSNNVVAKQPAQQPKQQAQQQKSKAKKEEVKTNHNNNNGPKQDEFISWCYKTLENMSTNVDIPTFVTFLKDVDSALDVKEYCKEYLGDTSATQQFASNFLEKRRLFKPKNNAHKDDMCSPAPAITPSLQHSTEFQEVKGKNKKNKKSKMLKVDSRILGFNVTSAPDRINVGDRDYGDNS